MNHNMKVVTRFAPSPTGFMHIGGLRTALFAWLLARKNNGTFILRIEDTDKEREVPGSIEHIQETLRWLNLEWDYGPDRVNPYGSSIQSERLSTYKEMALKLIEKGYAYPDPYSAEEVDAFRKAAQADKRAFLFRDHRPKELMPWDGTRPLRFKVPQIKRMHWHDEVRGDLEAGEEGLDDFILIKSDGYPTYNFAHIVDDFHMGVTHIMRADEFISSTPKFLSLYEALDIPVPKFVTLPPILRDDKTKKLGKRDGAKDILEYRNEGYLADAMLNFLVFIGWNPGTTQEIFSREELLLAFDVTHIQTHGAVMNEEKLLWYNREYMMKLPLDTFVSEAKKCIPETVRALPGYTDAVAEKVILVLRDRMSLFSDMQTLAEAGEYDFFFSDAQNLYPLIIPKKGTVDDVVKHLTALIPLLEAEQVYTPESIKNAVWAYAEQEGRGNVLWPLRVALTGREKSPDPFTVASILGKSEVLKRLKFAIESAV